MTPKSLPVWVALLALTVVGCAKKEPEIPSVFTEQRAKIRVVNLTGAPKDATVGGRKITGTIRSGFASPVNRMRGGESELVVKTGDEVWVSITENLDKTRQYSFYAYWQGGQRKGLLLEGDPPHGEAGFIFVRLLNLLPSGDVSGAARVGGSPVELGSGVKPGEAGGVTKVQPGPVTFSAKVGSRTVTLPPVMTAEKEAYTLVVSQDEAGKPMVNAIRNSESRMVSGQAPQ